MTGFLNLMPREFEVGDVWDEGLEVATIEPLPNYDAYRITFRNGYVEALWPAMAPRRIFRPRRNEP